MPEVSLQRRFDFAMQACLPVGTSPLVGAAVSGGPDSMALADLAQRWATARGGRVHAIMIDHRLRPGSNAELIAAARQLDKRGITSSIVVWHGAKPRTALQEEARIARYRLIAREATRFGILHLLIGHHQDDQIETIHMRSQRPGTGLGLSGMTQSRMIDTIWIHRPLLGVPKADLVDWAERQGYRYAVDPSNLSDRFERGRIRQTVITQRDELARLGRRTGRRRIDDTRTIAIELSRRAVLTGDASLHIDSDGFERLGLNLLTGIIKKCLTTVRGVTTSPALRSARQVAERIGNGSLTRTTLGGCVIQFDDSCLRICREHGRIDHAVTLQPGRPARWDDRYIFEPCMQIPPLILKRHGTHGGRATFEQLERAAAPALWSGDKIIEPLSLHEPSRFGRLNFRPSRVLIEPEFTL